ncbi:glycoside hydrolase domain-containing protein [Lactococcus fujiensis]|uniref:glycoside hydrolase domain-containing protein n=1 Tax=Lactococcus fujiensis TaxID=610251 RepID=UPI0006CF43EA|nr:glycoside hydrolase domain-containing protein [Lactococcus fujiensis]
MFQKNLTASEISLIINAGISIFPIYEDGGYILTHFTASQGDIDGLTASLTAKELGIPYGTTIYYAVDVDIEDGNIEGTVIPYFKNVYSQTTALGYRVGVYGTRNVCLKVSNAGYATASFVANMSTGWSGNLGFAMPHNWSFDQYNEFTMGTGAGALPVDQDTVSGRDLGFNTVTINKVQEIQAKLVSIGNILPILKEPAIGTISFNEEKMFVSGPYRVYIYLSEEANIGPTTDPFILNISNGKLTNKFMSDLTSFYDVATMPVGFQKQEVYNMIADNISEGKLSVSPIKRTDEVSPGIQLKFEYFDENNSNQSTTWKIQVFLRRETVLTNQPNDIDAFNVLMQCSQNVIGSTDVPNFLRMLETFISMTKQPDNIQISKTIATAGFITLVGAVMIGILLLPVA